MTQKIDSLILPEWIIPTAKNGKPSNKKLTEHAIAVHKGVIVDIAPADIALNNYSADSVHKLSGQAVIPGFVNAHTHAAMSLFKGLADDLPLMLWLENHIWPAEREWVSDEFCADGLKLAIAEMLKSGTTCFNDMYFQPNITVKVALDLGIRATVGLPVFDFPSIWGSGPEEYIRKGLALQDDFKHKDLINFAFAPHAPYTVSDAPLLQLGKLSNELDIPIHMHIHETAQEVRDSEKAYGKRPLKRLEELGLLTPNLIAVHMTQLQTQEMKTLAKNGVSVVHCPQSNMKLASGICPVSELLQYGVNVALGTDGSASNNDLDMFGEMQSAALLSKVISTAADSLPAHEALFSATYAGAHAMGLADVCGSIEVGKKADLVAVDLNTIFSQPVYDPISQIVYTAGREQVSHVWVNGDLKVSQGELVGINEASLIKTAKQWQQKIQSSRQ